MTHLSLFTGIGGLDLAAEAAGFKTVGQCEWADYPIKLLERHWPEVPRWRDIRSLTKESFYERTGRWTVDVVSGGFPCQPFSLAGKRRGRKDDRYLWPEMLRVIKELRPAWVVGENVAGLVSMAESAENLNVEGRIINRLPDGDYYQAAWIRQEDMLLMEFIKDLENVGYEVQAFVIPACAVGAPHRRDRLALVAHAYSRGSHPRRTTPAGQQREAGTPDGGADVAHAQRIGPGAENDIPHPDQKRDDQAPEQAGGPESCGAGPGGRIIRHADGAGLSDRADLPMEERVSQPVSTASPTC